MAPSTRSSVVYRRVRRRNVRRVNLCFGNEYAETIPYDISRNILRRRVYQLLGRFSTLARNDTCFVSVIIAAPHPRKRVRPGRRCRHLINDRDGRKTGRRGGKPRQPTRLIGRRAGAPMAAGGSDEPPRVFPYPDRVGARLGGVVLQPRRTRTSGVYFWKCFGGGKSQIPPRL